MKSILEFIRTGKIHSIELGMKMDDIERLLGKPTDTSISKNPLILKYGPLELAIFKDKLLYSIHYYFDGLTDFPLGLSDFFKVLIENEIHIQKDDKHTFDDSQLGLISDAKVSIIFKIKDSEEILESMHLSS